MFLSVFATASMRHGGWGCHLSDVCVSFRPQPSFATWILMVKNKERWQIQHFSSTTAQSQNVALKIIHRVSLKIKAKIQNEICFCFCCVLNTYSRIHFSCISRVKSKLRRGSRGQPSNHCGTLGRKKNWPTFIPLQIQNSLLKYLSALKPGIITIWPETFEYNFWESKRLAQCAHFLALDSQYRLSYSSFLIQDGSSIFRYPNDLIKVWVSTVSLPTWQVNRNIDRLQINILSHPVYVEIVWEHLSHFL